MPFKSKAQAAWMHFAEQRGEVPKGTTAEWASKTDYSKLPERVGKKESSDKKRRRWMREHAGNYQPRAA